MSAIAERIDLRLRQLPPQRAATFERIIVNLLDMIDTEVPALNDNLGRTGRHAEALAALNRIASRGGISSIEDAAVWQQEQRTDRILPGRDS